MKVTVITVSYNSDKTIEETIMSVLSQDYDNLEYIIIDSLSTDNTPRIIEKYADGISKYISEKDNGIYDAMNKGIKESTGDIICLLNSDDVYINSAVISKVVEIFDKSSVDCVYANTYYVENGDINKIVRYWNTGVYEDGKMLNGWHPTNPAFFVKKNIYEKYGLFDEKYNISADFEIILRFIERFKVKSAYLDEYVVKMRLGGVSNKSLKNIIVGNINIMRAFKDNGISVSYLYPLKRIIKKILQYKTFKK